MRLVIVLLGLSTLAVAGPLPSLSKSAVEARAQLLTPADNTLDPDSIAALSKLKATDDSPNNQAPGLKARSSDSVSTSANITPGPDVIAALNEWKMVYNNLDKAEANSTLIDKRGFWSWAEDKLAEEGLWPRSSDAAHPTPGRKSIAALTKSKAGYDSRNAKRTESDLARRGFWSWLKKLYGAPPNVQISPRQD